ncbi:MAG: hypothetical protein U0869_22180 [Chloroflexota bacterium]
MTTAPDSPSAPAPKAPRVSRRARALIIAIVVVLAILVALTIWYFFLRNDSPPPIGPGAPLIPGSSPAA